MVPTFADRLVETTKRKGSVLVAGLDPQLRFIPPHLIRQATQTYGRTRNAVRKIFADFNREVIDAVEPYVVAVKPQMAFYEIYGTAGIQAFEDTVDYARKKGLLVITDAKRGDGGDTADAYADGHLGKVPFFGDDPHWPEVLSETESPLRTDCLTIHGWIGEDCVGRFVGRTKKHGAGLFVVAKTSFKPNSAVEQIKAASGLAAWQELALLVGKWGEGTEGECGFRNVGVVMGATYPEDAKWMREALPSSLFLVPGYGGQGASADDAVVAANQDGLGIVVNSSRGITYAYMKGEFESKPEEFAEAARSAASQARHELNMALCRAGKGTVHASRA